MTGTGRAVVGHPSISGSQGMVREPSPIGIQRHDEKVSPHPRSWSTCAANFGTLRSGLTDHASQDQIEGNRSVKWFMDSPIA